jgi:hypothetical protein
MSTCEVCGHALESDHGLGRPMLGDCMRCAACHEERIARARAVDSETYRITCDVCEAPLLLEPGCATALAHLRGHMVEQLREQLTPDDFARVKPWL